MNTVILASSIQSRWADAFHKSPGGAVLVIVVIVLVIAAGIKFSRKRG